MIFIDYKDTRPIYEQVVQKYARLILNGVIKADTKMPSVRTLAMDLSINPNTIQKAYMELERQGYIYTVKGKGSFVSNPERLVCLQKETCIDKIREDVKEAGEYGVSKEEILKAVMEVIEDKE